MPAEGFKQDGTQSDLRFRELGEVGTMARRTQLGRARTELRVAWACGTRRTQQGRRGSSQGGGSEPSLEAEPPHAACMRGDWEQLMSTAGDVEQREAKQQPFQGIAPLTTGAPIPYFCGRSAGTPEAAALLLQY